MLAEILHKIHRVKGVIWITATTTVPCVLSAVYKIETLLTRPHNYHLHKPCPTQQYPIEWRHDPGLALHRQLCILKRTGNRTRPFMTPLECESKFYKQNARCCTILCLNRWKRGGCKSDIKEIAHAWSHVWKIRLDSVLAENLSYMLAIKVRHKKLGIT